MGWKFFTPGALGNEAIRSPPVKMRKEVVPVEKGADWVERKPPLILPLLVVASLGLVALRSFVPLTGGWFLLSVCGFLLLYGLLLLAFRVVDGSDRIILAAVGRKLGLASLSVVE